MTTGDPGQPSEQSGGMEYPSLEDSASQRQAEPGAPVDYPIAPGLPPPVYYQPHAYGPGYDPYRPARPPGTSGKAIAALVCSVAGIFCCVPSIAGLILGVMAMRETKRTGQDGYPLALAATIIGGLVVAGLVLYLLLAIGIYSSGWQWAP